MKRHPSLIPLSRQHHGALLLAQMLKMAAPDYKGMPTDAAGKTSYALEFYTTHLLPHFAAEETVFEKIKNVDSGLDKYLEEIIEEHHLLRRLFEGLAQRAEDTSYQDVIGQALEKHIRREDRELFPMIERLVAEDTMAAIAEILNH